MKLTVSPLLKVVVGTRALLTDVTSKSRSLSFIDLEQAAACTNSKIKRIFSQMGALES